MPVAKAKSTSTASAHDNFEASKLVQNLGSNREQYKFEGNLRTIYGRD